MTAAYSIPHVERDLHVDRQHPWIRTLEEFGIPFFCYSAEGRRSYVSAAADALLRLEPIGIALGQQADQAVVAELSRTARPLQIRPFAVVREVPSCSQGIVLAIHAAQHVEGPVSVVVVIRPTTSASAEGNSLLGLTPREADVARLIAAGLATKEIAFRLGISGHTTRHHTEHVFAKLGVRCRAGVAALLGARLGAPARYGSAGLD